MDRMNLITKIKILVRPYYTDIVFVHMNIPSPFEGNEEGLVLTFETPKGKGEGFILDKFNLNPEIIEG